MGRRTRSRHEGGCGRLAAMPTPGSTASTARWLALATAALARPLAPFQALPERVVVVDAAAQRAALLEGGHVSVEFPVSTAYLGLGGDSGSNRTPAGWHRVHA